MFYSHQLLARKAPLGQIWMAATMHAKINRRKLDKLNIINICEEILNPSVPMALRLSGILMGGVVIVYERKVKLLYEDVTRLLVEINEAWKVKAVRDPTILPKGKSQAKYEAVTLPENKPTDLGEIEQPLQFSNSETLMGFQKNSYFAMKLDSIDEPYVSHNLSEADLPQDHHQADFADITLCELYDSYQADAGLFRQFERFDIEGDEDTQVNYPSHGHADMPSLVPSPPLQDEAQIPNEIHEQHPGDHSNHQSNDSKAQDSRQRQKPPVRRGRKCPAPVMDYEQTIIPGQMYQSWLQKTSDIGSRRGRKRKHLGSMRSMKMARLMDLPPVALVCGLHTNGNGDIYYPLPLLKLWMRSTQPSHHSPSGKTSPPHPPAPAPSSSSPPEGNDYDVQTRFPFEEGHSGVGSGSLGLSIEKPRENIMEMPSEILMEELRANLMNNGVSGTVAEADMIVTPSNSGGEVRSIGSSESGHGFMSDVNSGRSNKKRGLSSSRRSGSSLEPVAEEVSWDHPDPNFKLARLSENDLLVESGGVTQTQKVPLPDPPVEKLTESIRMQLKTHFDTPGSGETESLNQLALGLNRIKAACLFYQTCVLASRDLIRVEQKVPYGNILIGRGSKM
ncbi:sister chromatid cohesion 1 protein 1 [Cynara cardunculus var. scolymus]|uniref:sister chromatid cohesion 1 protein 1 n=1 Tax=Cynara cardunculus var. scolymus TaxID=59895 RepID=UPI000D62329E|nr:sister chromatid cohesion 1 protein 1 [Cynara cardunculus var. scolymus]